MKKRIGVMILIQKPYPGGVKTYHDSIYKSLLSRDNFDVNIREYTSFGIKRKDINYDIYHLFFSPTVSLRFFMVLLFLKIFLKKKVVVTYYNIKDENFVKRLLKFIILNIISDALIVPSNNMKMYYRKLIHYKKRIFVYLPCITCKNHKINKIHVKKCQKSQLTFLYFGALRYDKGIDILNNVVAKIKIRCDVYPILLPPKESLYFLNQIKRNKFINVIITKKFSLDKIVHEKYVSIFPYRDLHSTFDIPLALLESLALGIPVITTKFKHFEKYLPEAFLIDDWNDINKIKKTILKISKNYEKFSVYSYKSYRKIIKSTDGNIDRIYISIYSM